jgi:hypothetical protein
MAINGQEMVGAACAPATWNTNAHQVKQAVDLFFADERDEPEAVAEAIAICSNCPVRDECLDLYLSERFGVFGGKTATERKDMRRIVRMQ